MGGWRGLIPKEKKKKGHQREGRMPETSTGKDWNRNGQAPVEKSGFGKTNGGERVDL